jgi:hypothetical protein
MFGAPIKREGKSKVCDFKASGEYTCQGSTATVPTPSENALKMLQGAKQHVEQK